MFLARPQRWLWAMHRYRVPLSSAPTSPTSCVAALLDVTSMFDSELARALTGRARNPHTVRAFWNASRPRLSPRARRRSTPGRGDPGAACAARASPSSIASSAGVHERSWPRGRAHCTYAHCKYIGASASPRVMAFGSPCRRTRCASSTWRPRAPERREGRLQFGAVVNVCYFRSPAASRELILRFGSPRGPRLIGRRGQSPAVPDFVIRAAETLSARAGGSVGSCPRARGRVPSSAPGSPVGTARLVVVARPTSCKTRPRALAGARQHLPRIWWRAAGDLVLAPRDGLRQ